MDQDQIGEAERALAKARWWMSVDQGQADAWVQVARGLLGVAVVVHERPVKGAETLGAFLRRCRRACGVDPLSLPTCRPEDAVHLAIACRRGAVCLVGRRADHPEGPGGWAMVTPDGGPIVTRCVTCGVAKPGRKGPARAWTCPRCAGGR